MISFTKVLIFIATLSTVFAQADLATLSEVEYQTYVLTNAVRMNPSWYQSAFSPKYRCRTATVRALSFGMEIYRAARAHSENMANTPGCFKHEDCNCPANTACDPFTRMRKFGVQGGGEVKAIGENIAYGYNDAVTLMNAWLESADHCDNIFNNNYERVGIALVRGFTTQDFGGPFTDSGIISGIHVNGRFMAMTTRDTAVFLIIEASNSRIRMEKSGSNFHHHQQNVPACGRYRFEAEDGSKFPPEGSFAVTCSQWYQHNAPAPVAQPAIAPVPVSAPVDKQQAPQPAPRQVSPAPSPVPVSAPAPQPVSPPPAPLPVAPVPVPVSPPPAPPGEKKIMAVRMSENQPVPAPAPAPRNVPSPTPPKTSNVRPTSTSTTTSASRSIPSTTTTNAPTPSSEISPSGTISANDTVPTNNGTESQFGITSDGSPVQRISATHANFLEFPMVDINGKPVNVLVVIGSSVGSICAVALAAFFVLRSRKVKQTQDSLEEEEVHVEAFRNTRPISFAANYGQGTTISHISEISDHETDIDLGTPRYYP